MTDQKPDGWQWYFPASNEWLPVIDHGRRLAHIREQGYEVRPVYAASIADLEEALTGLKRLLWLAVKVAGSPAGVTIDRDEQEAFNAKTARVHVFTDPATGYVHIQARNGG